MAPSHNPRFEGKKGNKQGTPSRKAARGARKTAPKRIEKPFRLEVGKTYESEKGPLVTLTHTEGEDYCAMGLGVWRPDGDVWLSGSPTEKNFGPLLREVPSAKRPGARRAKGSKLGNSKVTGGKK